MADTNIAWTDKVWNPVTGCTKVSAGCKHCYAERLTERFGRQKFTNVVLHPDRLDQPLRWRKPRRIFVNSMSDLFHEDVPTEFIGRVFDVMCRCPQHTFQILTKRPQHIGPALGPCGCGFYAVNGPVPCPQLNVWLGVSCENQKTADERIPLLLQTPAAVRFVSLEPLLGPITLIKLSPPKPKREKWHLRSPVGDVEQLDALHGTYIRGFDGGGALGYDCETLDWVIVGGESGPGHRTMQIEWLESIVEQCQQASVPVFVKQDSGPYPGKQGRIPDKLWRFKEFPK